MRGGFVRTAGAARSAALAAAAAGLLALPAQAAGDAASYPRLAVDIPIEIQNDGTYDSEDRDQERNDLFTDTEPEVTLEVLPGLSLRAHFVLEPVRDPEPREDRFFEDHGLFVEDLVAAYESERFSAFGGKFTPNFGVAWDAAPGIYGTDFAEDGYEFSERIGFGGGVTVGNERAGEHTLSASTFFLDTSVLSRSLFRGRGEVDLADGGVSNTEDFSSFAVALDGGGMAALPGLAYHLAFIRQAGGRGDAEDERGVAVAATRPFPLGGELTAEPLVEYVRFFDADGVPGRDREFLTTSVRLGWRRWNLTLSRTGRDTDGGGVDDSDNLFQISAGYEFAFGLTADLGWRRLSEENVTSETVGALLTYTYVFALAPSPR